MSGAPESRTRQPQIRTEGNGVPVDAVDLPPYTGEPVLVIGNGPVGQTTALLLARWGVPTIVLDQRPAREMVGSKAICQQRDVLDIWDSVGAGRAVADEGVTWERARTFYREHELFCLTFEEQSDAAFPPFVNISQCRTEQLLDEQVSACDLIDVRWGHSVTALSPAEDGVTATVRHLDGAQELRGSYAVLCAGAHSEQLRSQLGVSFDGRSFEDHFLICDIRADLPGWEQERRFYFDPEWNPGRQVLIHPCPDSVYRIDWQVPADFDLEHEARTGFLDRRIRRIVGDASYEIVWTSVYRFHSRCADRMRAGKVLLAGDCAHVMAPFGARGLNSGVGDAENAAWKLAFVLRGWAGEALLDSYDAERRAAARENLEVTDATMEFLVPQDERARQYRRETLQAAIDNPDASSMVDSGRLAEPFWYVDSPLTTPDPTRTPAARPPRGRTPEPGVGVLLPDYPVPAAAAPGGTRLRRMARHGLTVLLADDVDAFAAERTLSGVVEAPLRVVRMGELTPDGCLAHALGACAGEAWVVRPDASVAAVVPATDGQGLARALRRAIGH